VVHPHPRAMSTNSSLLSLANQLQAQSLRNPYSTQDRRCAQLARSFFLALQHKAFYIFTQGFSLSSTSLYRMHKTFDHTNPILALSLYHIDTIFDYYYFLAYPSIYTYKIILSVGKSMGQHPFPITYSQNPKRDPKVGQDSAISTSSSVPSSTGCRSPKNGQHDQYYPITWSRANRLPTLTCDPSQVTLV
jgi:hypothetical protein